jgi:hypothetical protein
MKKFAYTLSMFGCILTLLGILRMFGLMESYITTDKSFLILLFMGFTLACLGFLFESKSRIIYPKYMFQDDEMIYYQEQIRRKNQSIKGMTIATILSFVLVIFALLFM